MITRPETNSKLALAYELIGEMRGGSNNTDDDPRTPLLMMRIMDSVYPGVLKDYLKELEYEGKGIDETLLVQFYRPLSDTYKKMEYCGKHFTVKSTTIPQTAQFKGKSAISFMGTTDADISFFKAKSSSEAMSLAMGTRWVEGRPTAWQEGNTLYFVLDGPYSLINEVSVSLVPEDPGATVDGGCFDIFSSRYPIAGHLWKRVRDLILMGDSQVMNLGSQTRDLVNDGHAV